MAGIFFAEAAEERWQEPQDRQHPAGLQCRGHFRFRQPLPLANLQHVSQICIVLQQHFCVTRQYLIMYLVFSQQSFYTSITVYKNYYGVFTLSFSRGAEAITTAHPNFLFVSMSSTSSSPSPKSQSQVSTAADAKL